jgi:hypothetical protein
MGRPKVTGGEGSLLPMAVGFQGAVIVSVMGHMEVDNIELIKETPRIYRPVWDALFSRLGISVATASMMYDTLQKKTPRPKFGG